MGTPFNTLMAVTSATSPPPMTTSGAPIAPGSGQTVSNANAFNLAWCLWRDPMFDPLFYGFAWSPNSTKPQISMVARIALCKQIEAAQPSGQNPVEAIEYFLGFGQGDPATANEIANMQGTSYWPPAGLNNTVSSIGQPGAVVPPGGYSGSVPAGCTAVVTVEAWLANPALLPPNPKRATPPTTPVNPVGPQEFPNSPYYSLGVPSQVAIAQYPTFPGPTPSLQFTLESEEVETMFGVITEYFYILGPSSAPAPAGGASA